MKGAATKAAPFRVCVNQPARAGSVRGALTAALLVGLVDTFGKVLLPQFASMLVYVLMALVLLYKPEGLFKQ